MSELEFIEQDGPGRSKGSEYTNAQLTHWTTHSDYDAFGRLGSITSAVRRATAA